MKASLSVNFERFTLEGLSYNPGKVKLCESPGISGALPLINYKNDQTTYEALRDYVIPLYKRFIRGLRALQPETEEVRSLNRIYIDGAESLLEGFKLVMLAIDTQDASLIRPANEYLEKGRLENERWRKELIALAGKHDVKPQEKKEGESRILDILLGAP